MASTAIVDIRMLCLKSPLDTWYSVWLKIQFGSVRKPYRSVIDSICWRYSYGILYRCTLNLGKSLFGFVALYRVDAYG